MVVNVDASETAHAGGWWKWSETALYFSGRFWHIVLQKWIFMGSESHDTCV
jgi:hypothetical protein